MPDCFLDRIKEQVVDLNNYDNELVRRAVLPRTEEDYQRALKSYDIWHVNHPHAPSPPDIQAYKAFLVSVARAMKGRLLPSGRPVPASVDWMRRDLETGWERKRGYKFPEEVTATMKEFVYKELPRIVEGMEEAEMDRHYLSPNDIMVALVHLWCKDFMDYKGRYRERTRVGLSLGILMYCFTSARTGEVHESTARRAFGRRMNTSRRDEIPSTNNENISDDRNLSAEVRAACYKHFELSIQMVEGSVMLVLTYKRQYVKRYHEKKDVDLPVHAFYEKYREKTPLLVNLLLYFLSAASADNAFYDYGSSSEILDEVDRLVASGVFSGEPGSGRVIRIRFRQDVLDKPVFRPYSELSIGCSTGKARGADAFGKLFAALGHRAGSTRKYNVRACRRWALNEASSRYSEVARQKFAGHTHRDTFGRWYAHPLSEVDGPATFLGIEPRMEHIKNLRSMAIYRNPELWQSLPAKEELEFQQRSNIIALDAAVDELGQRIATAEGEERQRLYLEQRRLCYKKQQLHLQALRDFQRSQPSKLGPQRSTTTYFNYTRRVMPERDRLAQILPMKVELRSPEGREALRAMEALCNQDCRVAYRSSLKPVDGKCRKCHKSMDELQSHRQWSHLYRCYSAEEKLLAQSEFAELCFECDLWFTSKLTWNEHCEEHLNNPENLLRYDCIMFRSVPVKPEYCPFCLWDKALSPAQRMRQHVTDSDRAKLKCHVEDHLLQALTCKHPACNITFESTDDLRHHLSDVHCWNLEQRKQKRKREETETETRC